MVTTVETILPGDPRLIWSGAISMQQGPEWVMPWRLPYADLAFYPPETLQERASTPSGVRLRLATDATEMVLATEPMEGAGNIDWYVDDALCATVVFAAGDTEHQCALPAGKKTVEIWLPQGVPFRLREIRVNAGAVVEHCPDPRPRWVTYGSSITHCCAASSPSCIWPGVVARAQGLHLTALGYGGQCHADPMLARLIRNLPAELISVKLGINIYGQASLNSRTFLPAVLGTLATIRDGHPATPFVVCSPIWSPPREHTPNAAGMTLAQMREEIAHAVRLFRDRGDANIYYVDGLDLFNESYADHLPDQLHPDAEGYVQLGLNFIEQVFTKHGIIVAPRGGVRQ